MFNGNHQDNPEAYRIFSKEFIQNPYPGYRKLREEQPVYKTVMPDGQTGWVVTKYEDAVAALKDKRFIKDFSKLYGGQMDHESIFTENMLFSDPPDHKRLRGLVQKAFTPRMIENMRGRIKEIADELLDRMENKEEISLIDDYAFPLPIIVISEILGVPAEDQDKFRIWSNSLIEGSNGENWNEIQQHMNEFVQYLGEWFAFLRENPRDDLISQLINAEEGGDKLIEKELYGVVSLLIIAGHETTVNLIGNGILSLLENPDQLKLLREKPELIHNAVEELLRYNGPVEYSTSRWAIEDVEFQGQTIRKGELVIAALNSANRDDEKFADPDVLDITREKSPHLAFGKGIHLCLGAPLARLEGEIAILALLERFPEIGLNASPDELEWRPGMIVRGVKELPLRVR
ncbi:cytochrome P450 family protein [Bacillus infantis]|uniref:Cytochrome P450 n=1 Tax=Bacillus infantis TaxID=324767 RepID=A0A5D4RCJ6_9BACI|nr:cytochrome P450 [Bacillus infantis]TYS47734.1 cytochrome P450 [Bacillus infantis]